MERKWGYDLYGKERDKGSLLQGREREMEKNKEVMIHEITTSPVLPLIVK